VIVTQDQRSGQAGAVEGEVAEEPLGDEAEDYGEADAVAVLEREPAATDEDEAATEADEAATEEAPAEPAQL
jgi:hypothetical protein